MLLRCGQRAATLRAMVDPRHIEPVYPHQINIWISLLRYAAITAAFWSMYLQFVPLAPPPLLHLWGYPVAAFLVCWAIAIAAMYARKPDEPEIVRIWRPIGRVLLLGTILSIAALVWLLLPYATDALRLMVVIFAMGYIATAVISTAEHAAINRIGIVVILGSIIAFHTVFWTSWSAMVIAYVALFSALMFILSRVFPNALRESAAARAAAEASRDARARFLASASHDLGQPLQSARLFFDQVARGRNAARRADAAIKGEAAFDVVERQLQRINDHLRLDADVVRPRIASIECAQSLARIRAIVEPSAQAAGIKLRTIAGHHIVKADADLLERALLNLVNNAVRHSKASRILIGSRQTGQMVRLWVIDDGCGVLAIDRTRIFDDYVQGFDHADEVRGGFGLGLGSAVRMARLMNGRVGIDVRWASGAAFYLELPGDNALV
jgi:signal transduction histidine kinase